MPALDQLTIEITADASKATRAISNLANSLSKLGQIGNVSKTVKTVEQMVKALGKLGDSEGVKKASSGISRLATSLGKLQEAADGIKKMDDIRAKLDGLSDLAKATPAIKALSSFNESARKTSSGVSGFGKKLISVPLEAFKSKVTGVIKPLGNLYNSFKRIAMYRALRTALKEITQGFAIGVKNLYAWAGLVGNSFVGTMDSLATSMNYLRNSLGAMVSPLLDALAPAVEILVDKFVDLINLVNQFFATITGKTTWRKAVRTAKEYADNTNDAAAAQAKLNHQLMAFDELNNISLSSPSGRGGGGSDDGVSADDFEELPLPDWAQDIKDAIARGDWAGAGQALADKLNGLINDWDSEAAGKALGQKLQNALTAYVSFMKKLDWEGLGTKIAGYLNGFLDKVDPQTLGEAIVAKFNAAIGFLEGFASSFDWTEAGEWIAGVIVGAVTGIDWETLGSLVADLAGGILDLLKAGIVKLADSSGDILSAIGDFFTGLGWDGLLNVVGLAAIVKGFKLLFKAVFGDDGLISTVKTKMGAMIKKATEGLGGVAGGTALTIGIALAVKATGDLVDNIKKYGAAKGVIKTFGKDADLADFFAGSFAGVGGTTLVFEALMQIKMDMETEELKKKLASKPVQNAIKFINGILRLAGLEEIKIDFDFPGLEQGRKDSFNLDKNLGGLENTYTTTVNAKNLTGNTTNANKYKTALLDVNGKTYRTTVTTNGLTGNTKNATSYKDNLEGIKGKTYSSTVKTTGLTTNSENSTTLKDNLFGVAGKTISTIFSATGLDLGAEQASTVKSNLTGVNNKTFWTTLSSSTLTDAANSAKKLYDNLNNSAKTWTVKVNGQIELTDPGKKYKLEASGGYVSAGTAFIAGEAGPELVGTINGRTGVVSANEISGIGDAIYNTGETEAALLAEQNALLRQILAKTGITLTPNAAAGKWVAQSQAAYARATGG